MRNQGQRFSQQVNQPQGLAGAQDAQGNLIEQVAALREQNTASAASQARITEPPSEWGGAERRLRGGAARP